MTTNKFLEYIKLTFEEAYNLIVIKNKDYADQDPFKNFRMSTQVGVEPARAILVRISDKLSRVSNLLDRDPSVTNERIEDTLNDIINYSAILKAYLHDK